MSNHFFDLNAGEKNSPERMEELDNMSFEIPLEAKVSMGELVERWQLVSRHSLYPGKMVAYVRAKDGIGVGSGLKVVWEAVHVKIETVGFPGFLSINGLPVDPELIRPTISSAMNLADDMNLTP